MTASRQASPSLGLNVHHANAMRNYVYDEHPRSTGRLVTTLDAAIKSGWLIVDMKTD